MKRCKRLLKVPDDVYNEYLVIREFIDISLSNIFLEENNLSYKVFYILSCILLLFLL